MDPAAHARLDRAMADSVRDVGASVHTGLRPGRVARGIVLRDTHDDHGTRFETAQIEQGGTLWIIGHDTGPRVSEFFGEGITSCEWVYIVAPHKIGALLTLLDGQEGDDILTALGGYHQFHGGTIYDLMRAPEVTAVTIISTGL